MTITISQIIRALEKSLVPCGHCEWCKQYLAYRCKTEVIDAQKLLSELRELEN